ncbi:MAG: flavodoxin-dependent (E)-4-hydroxy-3-methylbut-2-enyl-diphosphate synthase [Candidatus Omnitrophica bacterium]|nr:flavodoxin-dependent (E)-4-hydroxy-3-methylbut-2-enyl-diphosphate synthase [Candidatus Omnitrophota bacterium]
MIERRKTRTVDVGGVKIGSDYSISIQSMTKTQTQDVAATLYQVRELEEAGCEIVRVAVKDTDDAKAIGSIKKEANIPIVADIHFDYRLALEAVKRGADKIRINPGNISSPEDIDKVIDAVGEKNIPIRIGINSGSLMDVVSGQGETSDMMTASLLIYLENFQKRDFHNIVISLKSSSAGATVEAYKKMAAKCDYPFHVGVTAAGSPEEGIVKSSVGIGALLLEGIGDTIRVSLTGDPCQEVYAAKQILSSCGCRSFGPEIIACPTCGRCQVDLVPIVKELEEELTQIAVHSSNDPDKQLIIAIMGCEVNGPGEAQAADIGIAFGKGKGVIFRQGEVVKTVGVSEAVGELLKMIKEEI